LSGHSWFLHRFQNGDCFTVLHENLACDPLDLCRCELVDCFLELKQIMPITEDGLVIHQRAGHAVVGLQVGKEPHVDGGPDFFYLPFGNRPFFSFSSSTQTVFSISFVVCGNRGSPEISSREL